MAIRGVNLPVSRQLFHRKGSCRAIGLSVGAALEVTAESAVRRVTAGPVEVWRLKLLPGYGHASWILPDFLGFFAFRE